MQGHLTLSDSGFLFQQRAKEIVALADKARREIAEQEERIGGIVTIACVESVASHNLPTNGLLLVQQGIGCLICVQGSLAIRPPQGIRFVPLAPERITGHVLAWKKSHAFGTATTRFLQFIQSRYSDFTSPIFP